MFDRLTRHHTEDVTALAGLIWAGLCVGTLLPSALLWISPQCSTWLCFLSRATFKRSEENCFFGDATNLKVREGSITAMALCWLFTLGVIRGVYALIEQPLNSMLYKVWAVAHMLGMHDAARQVTYLGAFGMGSEKALELYTTLPDAKVQVLLRSKAEAKARVQSELTAKKPLAIKGARWTNGSRELKQSEEYPFEFADSIGTLVSSLFG